VDLCFHGLEQMFWKYVAALDRNLFCEGHHVLYVRILAAAAIFSIPSSKSKNKLILNITLKFIFAFFTKWYELLKFHCRNAKQPINSMQQSPREADSHSADQ
jgi:hypothetical protein